MNRNLDVHIAKLLGLDVLGEAPCVKGYCSSDGWEVAYDGHGEKQPVYLGDCFCDDLLQDEFETLGHGASCLKAVPFYHTSDSVALTALEQICSQRGVNAEICYTPGRDFGALWTVELLGRKREFGIAKDNSFALAVCKALAQLEEKE